MVASRYGRWAVITGASEGTGHSFAHLLAAAGIDLILIARRQGPLDALAAEIGAEYGVRCLTASVDLNHDDAASRIAELAEGREVGLFIANAGADPNGSEFLGSTIAAWDDLVARNVTTTMRCCHHFGGAMKARGRGGLILVGSGACYGGGPFLTVYGASKAFAMTFAEGLWAELSPHGVDVLYCALAATDTPELRRLVAESGAALPPNLASPDDAAREAIEALPRGPVHNFGLADDERGWAPQSAAERRARVEAMMAATRAMFAAKG